MEIISKKYGIMTIHQKICSEYEMTKYLDSDMNIFSACSLGSLRMVQEAVRSGESPGARYETQFWESGWTPIRYAALSGSKNDKGVSHNIILERIKSILKYLVSVGADINSQDDSGVTTLMSVAQFKRRESIVELLVALGADTSIKDHDNKTVFDYASSDTIIKILES